GLFLLGPRVLLERRLQRRRRPAPRVAHRHPLRLSALGRLQRLDRGKRRLAALARGGVALPRLAWRLDAAADSIIARLSNQTRGTWPFKSSRSSQSAASFSCRLLARRRARRFSQSTLSIGWS